MTTMNIIKTALNPVRPQQAPMFQGGLPKYEPDVFFGRNKHRHIKNDVQLTARDGDIYPQFDAFPFPYRMDEDRLDRYLDIWV